MSVGSRRDFAQCIYIDSSRGKYFVSYLGNKRRADTKKCQDQRTRNDGIWLQGEKAEAVWGIKDAQTQKSVRIKERETMESGYREKKQKLYWTLQRIGEEQKEKQVSLNNVKEQLEELDFSGEEEQRLKKTARALEIASETMEKAAASMSKD